MDNRLEPQQLFERPETHQSGGNNVNNTKRSACEACYVRKKRCVFDPREQECTHCMKEGQACVARKRRTKYDPTNPNPSIEREQKKVMSEARLTDNYQIS
ncbi:hypothetical protein N7495_008338 [Penicillium taxi]|uniref:uncharacterized protein n=1 Tax=Penicillium taxi TaxID=168475 RepID=UPI0025450083|nr:uncharacterized protein N7495_008338 [Penicillium taxi]KAJ5888297.1 hypothetical protein N7495_008338 [Penicillium taxi]